MVREFCLFAHTFLPFNFPKTQQKFNHQSSSFLFDYHHHRHMENAPTIPWQPPPPFPSSSRSIDLSPLEFILALLAVITIPALIYAFFFAVKCPPWPFRRRHSYRTSGRGGGGGGPEGAAGNDVVKPTDTETPVSRQKYKKEAHVKEMGTECPVCLSVFADGEEVKQLSACKHSFHASCIDMWLKSHSNCPICRASVPVKRSGNGAAARGRDDDLQQGLPDSSSLV